MTTGNRRIAAGDMEWPTQLGDLDSEPSGLWVSGPGNLRLLALRSVAIVGSRAATPYGLRTAGEIAGRLADAGWVIFSGAAFGIDAAAHRGALAVGGPTVAVLAGGVDVASPSSHEPLIARIRDSGAVVSERPLGETPRAHSFLVRNRLIAALCRSVIVVEAGRRSGALNTARQAEELGRQVLAIPGPVTSSASEGTHELIKGRRAELVTCAQDVLELIEPLGSVSPSAEASPESSQPELWTDRRVGNAPEDLSAVKAGLTGFPVTVDDLAATSSLPVAKVMEILMELRRTREVEQTFEGWRAPSWQATRRGP
ncbi:MAG: DNA-processing protein DprA [Candidatus Nanopelagicales bacterium]|nr:DNA-processing protein DprA [Candidatus Nanopelagicales bacterium]MDZ4248493.1 DNA-processing protein DprA [Candidatus Nanopelagicales bacterium]MDZ7577233.1 DNA-processing protein DprA [Candidatus Nanopelagicales bacterium]